MNEHLCQAEEHERAKQYKEQYTHIHQLANYFRHEKLTWVSDHFYTEALNIAVNVAFDSGKCVCEANERCALAAEVNDDLEVRVERVLTEHINKSCSEFCYLQLSPICSIRILLNSYVIQWVIQITRSLFDVARRLMTIHNC